MKMEKQEIEKWCILNNMQLVDNDKLVIDIKLATAKGFMTEDEVTTIAAVICKADKDKIKTSTRKGEVVCARWLVVHYFVRFAELTRHKQGDLIHKDYSTVVNIVKEIPYWRGWRLTNKIKFEGIVNGIHENAGIVKLFK